MPTPILIVRYGEIALKGQNRGEFERRLRTALKVALRGIDHGPIERPRGRILVRGMTDLAAAAETANRASRVFGVVSTSHGLVTPLSIEAIQQAATELVGATLERRGAPDGSGLTMRVETKRANKNFPKNSMAVTLDVANAIMTRFTKFGVKMKEPDLTIGVEVLDREALVFIERLKGPGGLPLASQGRGIALLSGGIDSPVAAWLAMKRGVLVECAYFHSAPYVGEASKQKAIDLARALAAYSGAMRLHILPLSDIQVAIKAAAPESYRTLLYRRAMNRIIAATREFDSCRCIITGESLGQVASQTVDNLTCIEAAADRIVLRPLIAFDKEETMALARRIGTLSISERPHPDCCTLFQPSRPKIRGELTDLERIESTIDLPALVAAAAAARETIVLRGAN